jgi:hypothetical protein
MKNGGKRNNVDEDEFVGQNNKKKITDKLE